MPQTTDTIPKIIHQTWKTCKLPALFDTWSSTWKAFNPGYQYRLWTDEDNLNFIKSRYPRFLADYLSYNQHIKRVDAVRYFYLYEHGGIYCDLDFECLMGFDDLLARYSNKDVILGYMGTDRDFIHCIPNAIMISKPKSPFWLHVIREMKKRINRGRPEFDTGPILLKQCYDSYENKDEIAVLNQDVFYGINWASEEGQRMRHRVVFNKTLLSEKEKTALFPNAYAVTYWTHSW